MRTDFYLDNVAVKLPNATLLGFNKWKAKRGDWVAYVIPFDPKFPNQLGHETLHYGRVVGRIKYISNDTGKLTVSLYVIALGTGLDFPMVRWIAPEDVRACTDRMPDFVTKLITADFSKLENIRELCAPHLSHGLSFGYNDKNPVVQS